MAHVDRIASLTLKAQERMFRLAERDCGLTLKAISLESNIPYNTIRSYAGHNGAPAMMPLATVNKLAGIIPDHLLSHLFEPANRHVVENGDDDGDYDTLATNCIDLASRVQRARHPASPAGVEIAPCERDELSSARRQLKARA